MDHLVVKYATFKAASAALQVFWFAPTTDTRVLYAGFPEATFTCSIDDPADVADFDATRVAGNEVAGADDGMLFALQASRPLQAEDGRLVIRNTTANRTKNFNLKVFSFQPGVTTSVEEKDIDFSNMHDMTAVCYDVNGAVTTDPTQAVKTVLDWEPPYNYEVIGGWVDVPPIVVGTAPDTWYVTCIGVPDVPQAYGGSVPFVYPCDIALVTTMKVVSDGRATQYLAYNPVYHTNKLRWIFHHPASSSNPRFQIYVEMFT